jgi:hypothetical protein
MGSRRIIVTGAAALALVAGGCKDEGGGKRASQPQAGQQTAQAEGKGGQAAAGTATGELVRAKYDEVVLKQQGKGEELKLKVDPSTQVYMDGRIVMIDRLEEGMQVRASFDESKHATRIETSTKGGAPGASGQAGGDEKVRSSQDVGGLGGASSNTPGQSGGPGGQASPSAGDPPRGAGGTGGSTTK